MQFLSKMVGARVHVLSAALVGTLMMVGCGASTSPNTVTATPSFSPVGGTFSSSQAVTIADTTSGAVLYCTTDGTTPTTSSPQCSQPTTVFKSEYLQAIAVAPGMTASAVAAAGYTINLPAAATPTFSPAGGTYAGTQTISITDATTGANIFYTTDGTVPTASSTLYSGSITVSKTQTISAIAIASGFSNSGVASAVYTINLLAATPVFSPVGGTYTSAQTVAISDATAGAVIYYTVDGSMPTASSTKYSGAITVSKTETISAIAVATGLSNSSVATATYTINIPTATPTFTPAAGTYTSAQTVTISDATTGAVIYYTLDGTPPTTGSTVYNAPITVSTTKTISAIAVAPGFTNSSVATAAYTVNLNSTATPTFTPAAGTYTSAQTVTISDATTGAVIYYTVDGTPPTTTATGSTQQYSGPITVQKTETISAIAVAPGDSNSSVATALYTLSGVSSTLNGTVLSGALPVSGAQVQLYAAGQSGYGSAATPLLTAPVVTNSSGVFTLTYNCQAPQGDLVYLVATGGDTGAGANSSLELMAALGSCSNLTASTKIVVNEVTTVASAYALSAFITTAPNVGSSSTNYQGLTNAFNTVSNLVDTTTGKALTITPAYAATATTTPVPFLNSSTVPQSRIDTLANILNGCVNSNGATCANLFSAATPPAGTAPSNSLQAIVNIAQNPGTNVASLFGLASPTTGPFQPTLAAAPGDWTMALTFTGAGLGIPPGTVGTSGTFTAVGPTWSAGLAIDATGNVWVAASITNSNGVSLVTVAPMLSEFNNLGAPLTPATTLGTGATPVVTFGGYNPEPSGTVGLGAIAIDASGNIWLNDLGNSVLNVSSSLPATPSTPITLPFNGNAAGANMAIDNNGNVWIAKRVYLSEVGSDGSVVIAQNFGAGAPSNGLLYGLLNDPVFDSTFSLWVTDQTSPSNQGVDLYQIDTSGSISYDAFPSPAVGSQNSSPTLVADGAGNIYGCVDSTGQSLNVFKSSAEIATYPITTVRGCGNQLVLDGQGHIFSIDDSSTYISPAAIDEFTTAGVLLSPANGYTGSSSGEPPTLNSATDTSTVTGTSAAVDGSGNLWVLNTETNGTGPGPSYNPQSGNVLVEYVGIAAPVVTPTSVALGNGQLGARP